MLEHIVIPLAAAFAIGILLGLEREMAHKPAGLRTQVLINVGTTVFVLAATSVGGSSAERVAANVLTGLGFLGAGVILQHGGSVRGLTTAALIWVNGSLGVAVGLGNYLLAGSGAVVALVALRSLAWQELDDPALPARIHAHVARVAGS